jgi:type VI secretion system secreted protein Hcp
MAFDCFLKIDGIDGESTDAAHKNWIELVSFTHGMSQTASSVVSSSGGGTSGRVNMQDFSVVKHFDSATPKLAEACCTGKHFPTIQMDICRAGGDKLKYMEYKLTESIVSSVRPGGSAQGGDEVPLEEVSFNFGKIEWTYTHQKRADGSGGGVVASGWDLRTNVKA